MSAGKDSGIIIKRVRPRVVWVRELHAMCRAVVCSSSVVGEGVNTRAIQFFSPFASASSSTLGIADEELFENCRAGILVRTGKEDNGHLWVGR
jgi:hypothetical protein